MAPRKRARYRVITTPLGRVLFDRLKRTWVAQDEQGYLLDYGIMREPRWTKYIPGRVKG